MEHLQHGMKQKWDKHFSETRMNISVGLMILGISCIVPLVMLWPQIFSRRVFNSRLAYKIMIDVDDYWSCQKEYDHFVFDEPDASANILSFYVFTVSNAINVIQRGFKPNIQETGPYGFVKKTYKYDITFHPEDSSTISYKEFNILEAITDPLDCKKMFYKMDKNDLLDGDPCDTEACLCEDLDTSVVVTNPLFFKLLNEEGSHSLVSQYSLEVFTTLVDIMTIKFPEATKNHLVANAMEEIFVFRTLVQVGKLLDTAFADVQTTLSFDSVVEYFLDLDGSGYTNPSSCGLSIYSGISGCPWTAKEALRKIREDIRQYRLMFNNVTNDLIPSPAIILNASSKYSFLNEESGLRNWMGVCVYTGIMEFPFTKGSAMITEDELQDLYQEFKYEIAKATWNDTITSNEMHGTKCLIYTVCYYMKAYWQDKYSGAITNLVYDEWLYTSTPVECSVYGDLCLWQWGQMANNTNATISKDLVFSLIDRGSKVNTNPNSMYYDDNSAMHYNTYNYCRNIKIPNLELSTCMDLDHTVEDAMFAFPASLASIDDGVSQVNETLYLINFRLKSDREKEYYRWMACNISYLMFEGYRQGTDYHDKYVVNYLNTYKNPEFEHVFTVGNWDEIGYAQWGGGYVTEALVGVFAVYNLKRDGMWYIGDYDYYSKIIEYNSWCLILGYPYLRISNVTEAGVLLQTLARTDDVGFEFRKNILYRATTLIGDGTNFVNDVGEVGEIAFTTENNMGNFSCAGEAEEACTTLSFSNYSSYEGCLYIQNKAYLHCLYVIKRRITNWPVKEKCSLFETSLTSPKSGVQCDKGYVYSDPHPWYKSRGNLISKLIRGFVIDVVLKNGLWCNTYEDCDYSGGGMFINTTVTNLLFTGYSDSSMLKYLNVKHYGEGVSFTCVNEPYDECGTRNYRCDDNGIVISVKNNITNTHNNLTLKYKSTPHDKFFAERIYIYNNEFLWPHSMNETEAQEHSYIIATANPNNMTSFLNVHYTMYPAWQDTDYEFAKFYQCQGRFLFGPTGLYPSCINTLNTGRENFYEVNNLMKFRGNSSLVPFDKSLELNGSINMQLRPYLWEAFQSYPYTYNGLVEGINFLQQDKPILFNPHMHLRLKLDTTILEKWDRLKMLSWPFRDSYVEQYTSSLPFVVPTRRFAENVDSWTEIGSSLGVPKDSFGMPYVIPVAMTSVQKLAGNAIFVGTVHNFGNVDWGGREYDHVTGTSPDELMHMTYMDYDPVTGKIFRRAFRHQVTL